MRPSITDAVLIQRIAAGDLIAHRELWGRQRLFAYTQAYAVLWDAVAAELAVLDAFEEVWRSAACFAPGMGSAHDWLAGIVRSVATRRRSALQKRRPEPANTGAGGYAVVTAFPTAQLG